ncbi:diguanylate cyclase [Rhodoplanes sp. TEM]|uniref:diguanylate cyclase n=1 Tax=Rhodoplanes tepidamans TaxID=200616 RepID=A0ABT5J3M0_RHOTP|nr:MULTISPECIES: diguanylate cyclase [Rhodoplanes]MDC7784259.1 diguanylate cyclase [Rhodoplanes tepidamans]MDC7983651.1 diguanylate cyclase [Rhodoplanes sp. TEM]MDQ0353659.1 diguanylate cyclase (GGDEF)-like protein [Rhodoplanes tepidamans]
MLLALLAVVPLILDRVHLTETNRVERIQTAYAEVVTVAHRARDAQIETIEAARALMQVVARAYVATAASSSDCASFLWGFVSDAPWVTSLSVVGPDGRISCSTRRQVIGLDLSDRDYVNDVQRTRHYVLSDYLLERSYEKSTVLMAFPIVRPGVAEVDVLLAPIDLHWLARLGQGVESRAGMAAYLIDGKGTVLAGVQSRERLVGRHFGDHPLVKTVQAQPDGTATLEGFDGVRRIYGYTSLPGTDARIVVGFAEREVVGKIDRDSGIAYLHVAFFGLLTVMAAWMVGEHLIVEPIRALARTATRIGQGDLKVRTDPGSWAPEFAPLASALADMADRLATRERELRSVNEHLEELASIDALSGLANRRSFDARLAAEWHQAAEAGHTVGLLMVDVDHFKLFNDSYGHVQGDACLRQIGRVLTAVADGPSDFAARWGGEEFVLLLPGAGLDRAVAIAERLRLAVMALRIRNEGAPCGTITVSVGVTAHVPAADSRPQRLIEAADTALYAAKRRGRNTTVIDRDIPLAEAG